MRWIGLQRKAKTFFALQMLLFAASEFANSEERVIGVARTENYFDNPITAEIPEKSATWLRKFLKNPQRRCNNSKVYLNSNTQLRKNMIYFFNPTFAGFVINSQTPSVTHPFTFPTTQSYIFHKKASTLMLNWGYIFLIAYFVTVIRFVWDRPCLS